MGLKVYQFHIQWPFLSGAAAGDVGVSARKLFTTYRKYQICPLLSTAAKSPAPIDNPLQKCIMMLIGHINMKERLYRHA